MKKAVLITTILALFSTHVLAQPIPDFSFTLTNSGCAPDSAIFTNLSTGAVAYYWDFGDFSNDTATNPVHEYFFSSAFVVKLTAFDTLGDSATTAKVISILSVPFAGFFWNPFDVCNGQESKIR